MPRNRVVVPDRRFRAESSAITLASSFDYIRTLADDFARIEQEIEAGRRAVKRSKANGGRLVSGVDDRARGVGK
jgi:hypothetical protein